MSLPPSEAAAIQNLIQKRDAFLRACDEWSLQHGQHMSGSKLAEKLVSSKVKPGLEIVDLKFGKVLSGPCHERKR